MKLFCLAPISTLGTEVQVPPITLQVCIVMMEALRILIDLGIQPKRTIRVALWSGEEQGLNGFKGLCQQQSNGQGDQRKESGIRQVFRLFQHGQRQWKI